MKSGVVGKAKDVKGEKGVSWPNGLAPNNGVERVNGENRGLLFGELFADGSEEVPDEFALNEETLVKFCFGAGFDRENRSSDSGRSCSIILFFLEYLRTLHGARVFSPFSLIRSLLEIDAFHLFLMLLSVLPGI